MMKLFNAPPNDASILQRVKEGYLLWLNTSPHIPKNARYAIGTRIENKFIDLLELTYLTYFTSKEKKAEKILECVLILDALKFLITVTWEAKFISNRHMEENIKKLDEIGRMFGGWKNSLNNSEKKNRAL